MRILVAAGLNLIAVLGVSAQQAGSGPPAAGTTADMQAAPGTEQATSAEIPAKPTTSGSDQTSAAELGPKHAYGYFLSPTIGLRETFSNNVQFGTDAAPARGIITDLSGQMAVRILAPRFSVDGTFRIDGYDYIPNHAQDRVLPYGDLRGTWEAAPNHLYLDAGVLSTRVVNDPFAAVSAAGPTASTSSLTQVRLAPRLEGDVGEGGHFTIRSQNGWTPSSSNGANGFVLPGAFSEQNTAELEYRPRPLGGAIDTEQDITHYNAPISATLRDEIGRLILRYALFQELLVGVHGGVEHLSFRIDGRSTGRVVGGDLSWRPSERTSLVGYGESRPYGFAWQTALRARTAFTALDVNGYRRITTEPQSLLGLSGIGDLQQLIEAIYVARYPDPTERAAAVDRLIMDTGSQTSTSVGVYSADVAMQSHASASIAYLTRRDVASLAVSELRHQTLSIGDVPVALIRNFSGAYRDSNVSLAYTHRLQPHLALTAKGSIDRAIGLGNNLAGHTVRRQGELQVSETFSPHLDGLVGFLYQNLHSTVFRSDEQTAAYVGLVYRL